jgi:hypothetical protein
MILESDCTMYDALGTGLNIRQVLRYPILSGLEPINVD